MGRAIRRLVTLYESLDDLLQAADDHAISENEDDDDEEELLTEEALERKQEYTDVYLIYSTFSKRVLGLTVDLKHLKSSYRCFRQWERQSKILLPIWIFI